MLPIAPCKCLLHRHGVKQALKWPESCIKPSMLHHVHGVKLAGTRHTAADLQVRNVIMSLSDYLSISPSINLHLTASKLPEFSTGVKLCCTE